MSYPHRRPYIISIFFFFNDTATTEIYTLSLHDALPISAANTASSQKSDLIVLYSSRRALAARLESADRFQALRDARDLEAERGRRQCLQLRQSVGGLLRARVEVAPHPGLRRAQILAVAGLVAHQQREPRIEQPQARSEE